MNRKAFAEKLREIKMSEYDSQMYEQYSMGVRRQVQSIRNILDSLQAKSADRYFWNWSRFLERLIRTWLKNQTSGELDDNRLIDGLTGEKSIYKKRFFVLTNTFTQFSNSEGTRTQRLAHLRRNQSA